MVFAVTPPNRRKNNRAAVAPVPPAVAVNAQKPCPVEVDEFIAAITLKFSRT